MSDSARAPSSSPTSPVGQEPVDVSDAFTAEELAVFNKPSHVDGAAALAWLKGEGPDPWRGESS